jgi:tRNA threonylcarbamoyl adenosine modification protein YeaZ
MILIVDTSSNLQYLSLVDESNNQLIDSYEQVSKNDHSSSLLVNIDKLLNKNNLKVKQITKIVCGIGPGSYTGTRVGLTICKSLAYSLNIDLHYVSSLILLSSGYEGNVLVKFDAKRNNYFSVLYNNNNILLEEKNRYIDDLNNEVKEYDNYIVCDETNIKINHEVILNNTKKAENLHTLSPNYLKEV